MKNLFKIILLFFCVYSWNASGATCYERINAMWARIAQNLGDQAALKEISNDQELLSISLSCSNYDALRMLKMIFTILEPGDPTKFNKILSQVRADLLSTEDRLFLKETDFSIYNDPANTNNFNHPVGQFFHASSFSSYISYSGLYDEEVFLDIKSKYFNLPANDQVRLIFLKDVLIAAHYNYNLGLYSISTFKQLIKILDKLSIDLLLESFLGKSLSEIVLLSNPLPPAIFHNDFFSEQKNSYQRRLELSRTTSFRYEYFDSRPLIKEFQVAKLLDESHIPTTRGKDDIFSFALKLQTYIQQSSRSINDTNALVSYFKNNFLKYHQSQNSSIFFPSPTSFETGSDLMFYFFARIHPPTDENYLNWVAEFLAPVRNEFSFDKDWSYFEKSLRAVGFNFQKYEDEYIAEYWKNFFSLKVYYDDLRNSTLLFNSSSNWGQTINDITFSFLDGFSNFFSSLPFDSKLETTRKLAIAKYEAFVQQDNEIYDWFIGGSKENMMLFEYFQNDQPKFKNFYYDIFSFSKPNQLLAFLRSQVVRSDPEQNSSPDVDFKLANFYLFTYILENQELFKDIEMMKGTLKLFIDYHLMSVDHAYVSFENFKNGVGSLYLLNLLLHPRFFNIAITDEDTLGKLLQKNIKTFLTLTVQGIRFGKDTKKITNFATAMRLIINLVEEKLPYALPSPEILMDLPGATEICRQNVLAGRPGFGPL